ncbi:MAG: TRAP transporter TatT component family protein [Anaeromyxobacter sp.]|nr:TRAP transporter TatT component family protein [Anaeromyxobacter sp.]MBL0275135.1 TRAP transporter TatT component family protein [Anaeromyxobacter sp.]
MTSPSPSLRRAALLAAALLPLLGCGGLASKIAARALTSGGDAYATDEDPELVRAAVPFGLKTMEGVLESQPEDERLLETLAAGFTQYGYAFVASDADEADLAGRLGEVRALRDRARRLFLRARDYGLRALDERRDGLGQALREARHPAALLDRARKEDVGALYWTASAWVLAIVNGKGDMGLVAELPVPVAMMERALALDEAWGEGALHEFFVSYLATRSAAEGGGPERVKAHLDRALALSMNKKVGPRVAYAEGYLVQAQDRAAFTATLEEVLSVDPNASPRHRLVNVLSQRRARQLLDHVDDLFL